MTLKAYSLFLSILLASPLFGQNSNNCTCEQELDHVHQTLKKAKSYKQQIKGKKKQALNQWKQSIKTEMQQDQELEHYCVAYLQKFVWFVKDQHNRVLYQEDKIPTTFPSYSIDSSELVQKLASVDSEDIAGIYFIGKEKIALIQVDEQTWKGVTLSRASDLWKLGMVRLKVKKLSADQYEMFEFRRNGILVFHKNIRLKQGRLFPTYWNKDNQFNFHNAETKPFKYATLNEQTDFIGIKTFRRSNKLIAEGKTFYGETLPKLNKPYLIIELRNNSGGSTKQAEPLIKWLKKNKTVKKVFVLINCYTGSAAELTALQLAKDARVQLVGEPSRGMLTYGYGNKAISKRGNCYNYETSFTVDKSGSKLLPYEEIGLTPDVELDLRQDWMEQVQNLIKEDNKK